MDILKQLTRIRKGPAAFHEKAQRFVKVLQRAGAADIVLMSCDVCEDDLHPGHMDIFRALCDELDPKTQLAEISARIDAQTPKEAFVRVQAQTALGYLTFCFFCDSTMCMNEVEYLDNPQWDTLQKGRALRYIRLYPEWKAKGFQLSGSTRHNICGDVLIPAGQENPSYIEDNFEGHKVQISFMPEDHVLFKYEPRLLKNYEPIES